MIKRLVAALFVLSSLCFLEPLAKPASATQEGIGDSQATVHRYVDAVYGSDLTGDGGPTSPWQTITYALSQVTGPDVEIHIAPGTYDAALGETFPLTPDAGISLTGSDRNDVIISGQDGQSVIYLDSSTTDILSDTVLSNITLQNGNVGLQIYADELHTAAPSITSLRLRWNATGIHISTGYVYHDGATISGVISNTEVISNTQTGIYMRSYGYFSPSSVSPLIANSRVEGNGDYGFYIQGSAVSANGTTAAPQIVSTHIVNNGSHGIFAEGTYQGWSNPQIERSWIEDNQGYGFYWAQGINRGNINASITNTVIALNHGGGVFLGLRSEYEDGIRMLRVTNSTVVDNENYGIYWQRPSTSLYLDVTPQVINTILWNPTADDLYSTGADWTAAEIQHSVIEDGDLAGEAGNLAQDPLFADGTNKVYELIIGSPAINAGDNANCPSIDFRGLSRPQNGTCEIGAFEIALAFVPIVLNE
jgi:hypothetical protein